LNIDGKGIQDTGRFTICPCTKFTIKLNQGNIKIGPTDILLDEQAQTIIVDAMRAPTESVVWRKNRVSDSLKGACQQVLHCKSMRFPLDSAPGCRWRLRRCGLERKSSVRRFPYRAQGAAAGCRSRWIWTQLRQRPVRRLHRALVA
jgi:hypothetical protein